MESINQPKFPPDQVEDFIRRLLAGMVPPVPVPAPVPEVPVVKKKVTAVSGGGEPETSAVFHAERRVMGRIVAPPWMNRFHLCCRDGGLSRPPGGFLMISPRMVGGPSSSGKRSLIQVEGFDSTPVSQGRGSTVS